MNNKDSRPNLYALLVGINEYHSKDVKSLKGCVNDVDAIEKYINSRTDFQLNVIRLINKEATRVNIIERFKNLLGSAKGGDTFFFFFAGHGVQEKTTIEAFSKVEIGRKFESLICNDSEPLYPEKIEHTCLADKEISYLISSLYKKDVHIVLAFDSCHSGNISRNQHAVRSLEKGTIPERAWEGFCFSEMISEEKARTVEDISEIIPESPHILFSACKDDEVAKELRFSKAGKSGFFTYSLTLFLMENKRISYRNLESRLVNFMRGIHSQTPHCTYKLPERWMKNMPFLGGAIDHFISLYEISYNPKQKWVLPIGEIHGLNTSHKVKVFGHKKGVFITGIEAVYSTFSKVIIPAGIDLQKTRGYSCEIELNPQNPIRINIQAGYEEEISDTRKRLEAEYLEGINPYFQFVEEDENPGYILHIMDSHYKLSFYNNPRAIVPLISKSNLRALNMLYQYMVHIGKWESFLYRLPTEKGIHPGSQQKPEKLPVELKIFKKDMVTKEFEEVFVKDGRIEFLSGERFILKLVNQGADSFYCSLFYFSSSFSASDELFSDRVIFLNPGDEAWVHNGKYCHFRLSQSQIQNNWRENREFMKLIISTDNYISDIMNMENLPEPDSVNSYFVYDKDNDLTNSVGPERGSNERRSSEGKWASYNYEFCIINPDYAPNE